MKKIKYTIFSIITFLFLISSVYAASTIIDAVSVTYSTTKSGGSSSNVQGAIDELYQKISNVDNICSANVSKPVIKTGLIPVVISDDGTVTVVSESDSTWYDYCNKKWANAVIVSSGTYTVGNTIPEANIESYFVWIPKYKYKLWNVESTQTSPSVTKIRNSIDIIFDTTNTTDSSNSCVTPMTSGGTGNCSNGKYMTHPAFISMGTNGFWAGKFETGYKGASSVSAAQVNSSDSSKIIVKPNSYSWRYNTVMNMFIASYNYKRSDNEELNLNSHMMKNTEWGAVAYLSHSKYGIDNEVNINNNSNYITGRSSILSVQQGTYPGAYGNPTTDNAAYNTNIGYLASTTGNISGIYDMSGGAHEYVASYSAVGSSGFSTTTIGNYDAKYFDQYNSASGETTYQYRILGDATGEMGPFWDYKDGDANTRHHNSWYGDHSYFVQSSYPWFHRGGYYYGGVLAGQFYFGRYTGGVHAGIGFRLVLAP